MAGFRVSVTGDDQVLAGLRKMNPGLNRQVTDPAMIESGLLVARTASQRTIKRAAGPPRPGILTSQTGRLRGSLTAESRAVDKSGLPGSIEAGSDVVYSRIHEFGGKAGRNKRTTIPKRPYLAPALELSVGEFPAVFVKWWRRQLP